MEMEMEMEMKGHPMLRGRGRKEWESHGFCPAQIKSLAVLCDTFIPSLSGGEKGVESFYLLSGSHAGLPDQVAHIIRWRVKAAAVSLAEWVLWLLSTRLGTWLLCGSACFFPRFPYLQRFEQIPQPKRERIMVDWSEGKRFAFLKFVFKLFKICCLFAFYSSADENGGNPAWKSIGYSPPDQNEAAKNSKRPLDNGVIHLSGDPDQDLAAMLKGRGFTVEGGGRSGHWRVECDAVVVGSGSGGGVAAATLAQAGYRVIVVEKGNYYARQDLTLLEGPSFERMYDSGGLLSTNDGKVLIMAGSTVGGGSAINWSACIPTPPHIIADWAQQYQLPLFATDHYQNAMKAVWERLGVQDSCSNHSFQNSILRDGCAKLGFSVHNVARNSTEDHFCGSCCYGCPTGDKKGTDETWLVDAVNAGAVILTGCKAEKVSIAGGGGGKKKKAAGVVATAMGGLRSRQIFVQAKVTVVACGALHTPALLRRSGLRNPNIGRNLHLHPVQMAWGYFPEENKEGKQHHGKSYEGGIITAMCKEGGTINQNPAIGPGSFAAMMPWTSGLDMKERMLRFSRTAHVFALVGDQGSGTVMAEKEIEYRIHESDKEKLRQGLARAVRILIAAGAAEVGTHRSDGLRFVAEGASKGEIEEFVSTALASDSTRRLWSTVCSAHQMGSCRMGRDEDSGGVDWKGEAWEVGGLFVCDGSLLPTSLGVNPMITIQSVALCISNQILHFLD